MAGRMSPATRLVAPSQLRKLRGGEQVAAVCYRLGKRGIEFLLVRTRGGRWTFPKGGAEPGLTNAQAAALEAFEEAGVHGRMEEASFARYVRRDRGRRQGKELYVSAHLCEVTRRSAPQESRRYPTWFPAEKAKSRLRSDRGAENGAELARVVDRAVSRIQRLLSSSSAPPDSLQKVQFEVLEATEIRGPLRQLSAASLARYVRRQQIESPHSLEFAVGAHLSKVLRFSPRAEVGPPLLLGVGKVAKTSDTGRKPRRG